MESSRELPWWGALPLSLGWAVMGMFAPTFLPEWTQALFFGAAIVSVLWGGCATFWHYRRSWGRLMVGSVLVMLLGVSSIAGGLFLVWIGYGGAVGKWAIKPDHAHPSKQAETPQLTARQIFDSDFPDSGKTHMTFNVHAGVGFEFNVAVNEFWNFESNSFFLSAYILDPVDPISAAKAVADDVPTYIAMLSEISFEVSTPGDTRIVSNLTMKFTQQIFFYFDTELSPEQLVDLSNYYRSKGYDLTARTSTYFALHWHDKDRKIIDAPSSQAGVSLPKGTNDGQEIKIRNNMRPEETIFTHPQSALPPNQAPQSPPAKK